MGVVAVATCPSFAATKVTEGDDARTQYEAEKAKAKTLAQKEKVFILRAGGAEAQKPEKLTVTAGERFFITNEEAEYVHNVFDESDAGWVLKKQDPGTVAAISFDSPGVHKIRCAIHPQMKTTVIVE